MKDLLTPAAFAYVALLFQALGFLARDELVLRLLIIIGTIFYLLCYFFTIEDPSHLMLASGLLGLINLTMIVLLVFERTTFTMSAEMHHIYKSFSTLNPGQFRKVFKAGVRKNGTPGTELVTDGRVLDRLLLVTDGQVQISKGDKKYKAESSVFIGEVSFLREGPASATVEISRDSKYIEWQHEDLRRLMRKNSAMNNALIALFGAELAGKVENAMPVDLDKT